MHCPYCVSEIPDSAIVCAHCRRDLFLFRPLLDRISALERNLQQSDALGGLQNRVAALEAKALAADQRPASEIIAPTHLMTVSEQASGTDPTPPTPPLVMPQTTTQLDKARSFAMAWLLPLALLMAAHAIIVVVYDLNLLYLRVVSLLLPLPFGIAFSVRSLALGRRRTTLAVATAATIALAAVTGMSWTTHIVDHVPVFPVDLRELREFVEYAASIALSYGTGILLAAFWQRHRWHEKTTSFADLAEKLARLTTDGQTTLEKIETLSAKINALSGSLAATGTGLAATYTGLRAVVGG